MLCYYRIVNKLHIARNNNFQCYMTWLDLGRNLDSLCNNYKVSRCLKFNRYNPYYNLYIMLLIRLLINVKVSLGNHIWI